MLPKSKAKIYLDMQGGVGSYLDESGQG